jgi:hypothetical protein
MLKMSISILRGLAAEWALLHHVDESRFKFKIAIFNVRLRCSLDIGTGWSFEIVDALLSKHQCGFMWWW